MATKPRRTSLRIDDPAEDVPRLITGGGKACGGEWGLVLRPTEGRGVLVLAGAANVAMWQGSETDDTVAMPKMTTVLKTALAELRGLRKGVPRKAAAKAARSCARGQQSLTAMMPPVDGTESVPTIVVDESESKVTTPEALRALTKAEATAFRSNPKSITAKRWVKAAVTHLGLDKPARMTGRKRPKDGPVAVKLSFNGSSSSEVEDKLRVLQRASPRGLLVDDWLFHGEAASAPVAAPDRPASPEVRNGEESVDSAKDKLLLDAFSAAIAAAMQGAA